MVLDAFNAADGISTGVEEQWALIELRLAMIAQMHRQSKPYASLANVQPVELTMLVN